MAQSILITGGAGFIGSHLAEHYAKEGKEVYIIDDLSTGSVRNIATIREMANVHLVIDDVRHKAAIMELVDQADVIFHLAAAVGVRLVVESPVYTIEDNIHSTEVILAAANKKKKKVILASTSEVYGCGEKVPFAEDDFLLLGAPTKGRWAYACSKLLDEFLALAYYKEKQVPVVIVRLFNTVGPKQTGRYGMVLPNFVRQALAGQNITVFGDGKQSRCFAHINDVLESLLALADDKKAVGEIFNIGTDEEITIQELAKKVKSMTGSLSKIVNIPYDEAYSEGFEDMPRRVPDLTKIRTFPTRSPRFNLDQTIQSVIEYFAHGNDLVLFGDEN